MGLSIHRKSRIFVVKTSASQRSSYHRRFEIGERECCCRTTLPDLSFFVSLMCVLCCLHVLPFHPAIFIFGFLSFSFLCAWCRLLLSLPHTSVPSHSLDKHIRLPSERDIPTPCPAPCVVTNSLLSSSLSQGGEMYGRDTFGQGAWLVSFFLFSVVRTTSHPSSSRPKLPCINPAPATFPIACWRFVTKLEEKFLFFVCFLWS